MVPLQRPREEGFENILAVKALQGKIRSLAPAEKDITATLPESIERSLDHSVGSGRIGNNIRALWPNGTQRLNGILFGRIYHVVGAA